MTGRHLAQLSAVAVGVAAAGGMLLLVGVWAFHARPVLQVASTAQECINAPDHVASLFSTDQSTLIRLSTLDHSDTRVLRVEPASSLPGMFDSLLALSGDSRRLAYVTADDEQMDNARIQYLDVASPSMPHVLVSLAQGMAPIRPAWSRDDSQLAYVVGRPAGDGRPAGFEVWSVHRDASLPPQKVADLPLAVFTHGNSASLCFTSGGQVGLLQRVDAARGQLGPSPFTAPSAASSAGADLPSPASSPCGVPVFSQNDPSWRQFIMQAGGDPIGGFGCALTSTAMLLDYYGGATNPAELNSCLGSAADPIVWQQAPPCAAGKTQGGRRVDFTWDGLDSQLKAGNPVIVGMLSGQTGSHFVVVTHGGGGEADQYAITDPWDGSTSKTLGSYTSVGYNPVWIVSYDGPGRNCARLVAAPPSVQGVKDGGAYHGGVTVTVPQGSSGTTTVQQVPGGNPSIPASIPAGATTPIPTPARGPAAIHLRPGDKLTVVDEGIYLITTCAGWPPRCRFVKFTIDRTPPVISLHPLNAHLDAIHTMAFRPAAIPSGIVLDRPGRLRLDAQDTLSGVAKVEYRLDGSGWTPYSDEVSFVRAIVVPAVGAHTISVRAADLAGNVGEVDDLTFQVDSTLSASPGPAPTPAPNPTVTAPGQQAPWPTSPSGPTPTPLQTAPLPTPTPPPTPPPFSISASVDPTNFTQCGPTTFTFTAVITYTGSASGGFPYTWVHSDGTMDPQRSVSFSGPGTQQVQATWTVSAAPGQPYLGSAQLELLTSPAMVSNQAAFTLSCFL